MKNRWPGFFMMVGVAFFTLLVALFAESKPLLFGGLVLIGAGMILGSGYAFLLDRQRQTISSSFQNALLGAIFVAFGGFLTYVFVVEFGLHSVAASALVGVFIHFLVPKYEAEAFCGSFAGMAIAVVFSPYEMILVVVLTAMVFFLTTNVFKGFGGKLGTIAFAGSMLAFYGLGSEFVSITFQDSVWIVLALAAFGALSTYGFQHYLHLTPVLSSAVSGLGVSLIGLYLLNMPSAYIVAFYGATFVGMADTRIVPSLIWAAISGVVFGLVFYLYFPYLNGVGGKLGMMAFVSVLSVFGFRNLVITIVTKWKHDRRPQIENG